MELFRFPYSLKNIPIPPEKSFMKKTIDKKASFVSRIRWATDAFLFPDKYDKYEKREKQLRLQIKQDCHNLPLLKPFEDELYPCDLVLSFSDDAFCTK